MVRLGVLALVVAGAVGFITNPNRDAHRQAVYSAAAAEATNSPMLGKIAGDLLGATDVVPLTYNNYFVCSTTAINGEVQSVGAFSKVWKWK